MDLITVGFIFLFGALLLPPKNGDTGGTPDFDSSNVAEAQPIPLSYINGFTTSTLDPITVNHFTNQVVGTDSYLTMVQTSSYEFLNIQPDEVVPKRFKNTQPTDYFFTVPNNSKTFSWNVPDIYYVLRITPSDVNAFDHVQVIGRNADDREALTILQNKMNKIVSDYNRMLANTDSTGNDDQENPQDGIGSGEDFGGFNVKVEKPVVEVVEETQDEVEETQDEIINEKIIIRDNGNVWGRNVNIGGSPYGKLGGF